MLWKLVTLTLLLTGRSWSFNVALTSYGARCVSSSYQTAGRQEHRCVKALDGFTNPLRVWRSDGDGADAWLLITFAQKYTLTLARFMQIFSAREQIKDISLTFDENVIKQITLLEHRGSDYFDISVASWEEFALEDIVSHQVLIEVDSVYTAGNNGFAEVEFHADPSDCRTEACMLENVALSSRGASCTSSVSVEGEGCEKAIDGVALYGQFQWSSDGVGVGAWIEIKFARAYEIVRARLMQKTQLEDQFRNMLLQFDDDTQAEFELFMPRRSATSDEDSKQMWWDEFDMYPVFTSFVRLTAVAVYRTQLNGFMEIEFYARTDRQATPAVEPQVDGECKLFGISQTWWLMAVSLGFFIALVYLVQHCRCNNTATSILQQQQPQQQLQQQPFDQNWTMVHPGKIASISGKSQSQAYTDTIKLPLDISSFNYDWRTVKADI